MDKESRMARGVNEDEKQERKEWFCARRVSPILPPRVCRFDDDRSTAIERLEYSGCGCERMRRTPLLARKRKNEKEKTGRERKAPSARLDTRIRPLPAPFLNRDDEIRSRIRESLTFALKVYYDTHLV